MGGIDGKYKYWQFMAACFNAKQVSAVRGLQTKLSLISETSIFGENEKKPTLNSSTNGIFNKCNRKFSDVSSVNPECGTVRKQYTAKPPLTDTFQ